MTQSKITVAGVLMEGLVQKLEGEAMADLIYGVGTPERAAYEARLQSLMDRDFAELVDVLRKRAGGHR